MIMRFNKKIFVIEYCGTCVMDDDHNLTKRCEKKCKISKFDSLKTTDNINCEKKNSKNDGN